MPLVNVLGLIIASIEILNYLEFHKSFLFKLVFFYRLKSNVKSKEVIEFITKTCNILSVDEKSFFLLLKYKQQKQIEHFYV